MPDLFVATDTKEQKKTEPIKASIEEAENKIAADVTKADVKDVGRTIGIFHSFCVNPTGLTFKNQDDNEKILLFVRRHWVTNVPWILRTIVLLFIPAILSFLSSTFDISFNFLPTPYNFYILLFYFYLVILAAFVDFISWFYNIGLVTDERVMDVDLKNLVYTHVAATKISQIEDVSYSRTGALRSIFDYGDVEVQTAAEHENFQFLAVPNPNLAVNIIEDLIKGGGHK